MIDFDSAPRLRCNKSTGPPVSIRENTDAVADGDAVQDFRCRRQAIVFSREIGRRKMLQCSRGIDRARGNKGDQAPTLPAIVFSRLHVRSDAQSIYWKSMRIDEARSHPDGEAGLVKNMNPDQPLTLQMLADSWRFGLREVPAQRGRIARALTAGRPGRCARPPRAQRRPAAPRRTCAGCRGGSPRPRPRGRCARPSGCGSDRRRR